MAKHSLDQYYAVKYYNTREAAHAAGLQPPNYDPNKPIKTWVLPETAANGAVNYAYSGLSRREDGEAFIGTHLVPRRELPLLNVPSGVALGGSLTPVTPVRRPGFIYRDDPLWLCACVPSTQPSLPVSPSLSRWDPEKRVAGIGAQDDPARREYPQVSAMELQKEGVSCVS